MTPEPEPPPPVPAAEGGAEPLSAAAVAQTAPAFGGAADIALDALGLPTRMVHWAERQGRTTLRELASVSPAELRGQRNLGQRSIDGTRAIVEARLRARWEDLAAGGGVAEPVPAPVDGAAPLAAEDVALATLGLPARMVHWAARNRVRTLRALSRISPAHLRGQRNMGRRTIRDTRAIIEPLLGVAWEIAAGGRSAAQEIAARREALAAEALRRAARDEALAGMPLIEAWKAVLADREERARAHFEARAGLGGRRERRRVVAARSGVSQGKVQRDETLGLAAVRRAHAWIAAVRARADAALAGGATPLGTLAGDPWWAGIVALPAALDYFGERVMEGAWHVVRYGERSYLARCSQEELDEARSAVLGGARRTSLPAPLAEFRALLDPWAPRLGALLAETLFDELRAPLFVDETEGAPRVTARLRATAAAIVARVRASPEPVQVGKIHHLYPLPGDILHLGRGVLGLPRDFPDYAGWQERLVPAAIGVMERGAPERQWHAAELRDALREPLAIPDWLTAQHLESLLLKSGRVRSLSRMKFVLPAAPRDQGYLTIREELVRILRRRGGPMMAGELLSDLRRRTGATAFAFHQAVRGPPFMRLDRNCYGLLDRDLPGRKKARAQAVEHVAALLAERGHGLGAIPLQAALARLGPAHARWTPAMCLSALRDDPRFQQSASGAVGLSIWESVRVPTRLALLGQCLDRGGGRVRAATALGRIEAVFGKAPSEGQLWSMAQKLGASLRQGWIERAAPTAIVRRPRSG